MTLEAHEIKNCLKACIFWNTKSHVFISLFMGSLCWFAGTCTSAKIFGNQIVISFRRKICTFFIPWDYVFIYETLRGKLNPSDTSYSFGLHWPLPALHVRVFRVTILRSKEKQAHSRSVRLIFLRHLPTHFAKCPAFAETTITLFIKIIASLSNAADATFLYLIVEDNTLLLFSLTPKRWRLLRKWFTN